MTATYRRTNLLLQQHFDHKAKLSTYDVTIRPGTEYAKRFGVNTVNIVHDYNTGTIIQHRYECRLKCFINRFNNDNN